MTTIWKYSVPLSQLDDLIEFDMPKHAEVLSVGNQDECLRIWARVDPKAELKKRRFRVAGTGHPLGSMGPFCGTVQFAGGTLVFHVFEVSPK